MKTLRLLSANGEKNVLVPATPRKKKLRQGDKIVKVINDDIGENLTENINEAYVYHDPDCWKFRLEDDKDEFPNCYKATIEAGGGSYKLIEVKIVEA